MRIVRVLSTRRMSGCLANYEALYFHFEIARVDKNHNKKVQRTFACAFLCFVLDSALMLDVLQELPELCVNLQEALKRTNQT